VAKLQVAKLQVAKLQVAKLQVAKLQVAKLQVAILAILQPATLQLATLQPATLQLCPFYKHENFFMISSCKWLRRWLCLCALSDNKNNKKESKRKEITK
ncbi:MAG: hypothetical protein KIH69_017615, partial [Anaerolineae bacterium]|nr:hypothetical protein [Anaerolineae bacterium]